MQTVRSLRCCKEITEAHTALSKLCTGKSILFQDLNARLLQRTGTIKNHKEKAERNEPKRSTIPTCDSSPFTGPHGHTCTQAKHILSISRQKNARCTNVHRYRYVCAFTKAMLLCLLGKTNPIERNHTNTFSDVCVGGLSGITSPVLSVVTFLILNFYDGGIPLRFQLVAFTV